MLNQPLKDTITARILPQVQTPAQYVGGEWGAVVKDPDVIARRAVTMAREKGIESINGKWIDMEAETLCIHGDNAESIEGAQKIRELLQAEQISVAPLSRLI